MSTSVLTTSLRVGAWAVALLLLAAPLAATGPQRASLPQPPLLAVAPALGPSLAALDTGVTTAAMATALDIDPADLIEIAITSIIDTTAADSRAYGIANGGFGSYLPLQGGSFVILDCGDIGDIPGANDVTGQTTDLGDPGQPDDGVKLKVVLRVPAGMRTFSFNWHFLSEEYPEYVGSAFNDFFFCEAGGTNITYSGNTPIAPLNVVYDYAGKIMSVNSDFFIQDVAQVTGTEFDGQTKLLRTCIPCTPGGTLTLYFSVADMGDAMLDSAVFLDNFLFSSAALATALTVDAQTSTILGLNQNDVIPHAYPNPFIPSRSALTFEISNLGCGIFRGIKQVEIYTLYGSLVNRISGNNVASVAWDGTNLDGARVASGIYLYTVTTTDNVTGKGRFTLVR